jgi:hypothetical protein
LTLFKQQPGHGQTLECVSNIRGSVKGSLDVVSLQRRAHRLMERLIETGHLLDPKTPRHVSQVARVV